MADKPRGFYRVAGRRFIWWVPVEGDILCGYALSSFQAQTRIDTAILRYLNSQLVTTLQESRLVH